jgi:tartrate-resistant acid phosphatase type 5
MAPPSLKRREFLKTGLLFSASLMAPRLASSATPEPGSINLLCFGDWGTKASDPQRAVAHALQTYSRAGNLTPDALLLLGDNFYGPLSGVDSPRWKIEFEDMYPAKAFPGPCYAVLGNHDYDDQPGGQEMQLAYARQPGTRWKMPSLWYRVDLPAKNPVVTLLCLDTHFAKLSPAEISAQQAWLEAQFAAPRTSDWLLVCGHHPIVASGGHHKEDPRLVPWKTLFGQHGVDAYICGHEHDLQHLRAEGVSTDWYVSGGGGQNLHPVKITDETHFGEAAFGFLHLAASPQTLSASFIGTNAKPLYTFERKRQA